MSAQLQIDRLARTEGIEGVGAAPWPHGDEPCVFAGQPRFHSLILAVIGTFESCCEFDSSLDKIQITLGDHAIVVERSEDVCLAVISQLGHPVRKSLRRSLRRTLKHVSPAGVRLAAKQQDAAQAVSTDPPTNGDLLH